MGATREPQVVETCPNGRRDAPAPGAPKTGYPLRGAKIKVEKVDRMGSEGGKKSTKSVSVDFLVDFFVKIPTFYVQICVSNALRKCLK